MKLGIIVAMAEESEEFASLDSSIKKISDKPFPILEAKFGDYEIQLITSGIGKTNAAMATTALIHQYHPDMIINIGIAAGLHPGLNVGDVVICETTAYFDVDVTVFGYSIGQVPRMPHIYRSIRNTNEKPQQPLVTHAEGIVCSGDLFLASQEKVDTQVKQHFPNVVAMEMEAAAIGQVCHCYGLPFLLIKGISDKGDESSPKDSEINVRIAMRAAVEKFKMLIDQKSI